MGELDNIRDDIAELQRWRGEVEHSLGKQNGLRTGLEREVEGLRADMANMRVWLDRRLGELRRDQLEIRNQLTDIIKTFNARFAEIERPVWTITGKVAILTAVVLGTASLVLTLIK